jgi:hypothetical protein
MKRYEAHLQSTTSLGQGRHVDVPKERSETDDAYRQRVVRARLHVSMNEVYIPPMAIKKCLEETAFYLKMQIPGKGKETYTKHIVQGVLCNEPMMLGVSPDQARIDKHFGSLTPGKANSGRGWIYYPVLDSWEGVAQMYVVDDRLNAEVLRKHLELAGVITGLGVWRPRRGGMWGKFKVLAFEEFEVS